MTPRSFLALAAATLAGILAATGAVVVEIRNSHSVQLFDEPMFPELVNRANEVAKVIYSTPTEETVIQLRDAGWIYPSRSNYPVPTANVRNVVSAVAALRRLEPKTDDPAKYARLGVEDVGPAATSRQLVFETARGERLAGVVIGRTSSTMAFDPLGGTYLRVPGEAKSWLARGTVALPPSALDWMERQVVHVPAPDVVKMEIREGGTSVFLAEKLADADGVQRYQIVPRKDNLQAADSAVKAVASGTTSLNFDDVKPAGAVAFADGARELVFTTRDGLVLTSRVAVTDNGTWVQFTAAAAPGSAATGLAKTITDATAGWAFLLQPHKVPLFNRPLAELTEPKAAVASAPEGGAPAGILPPGLTRPNITLRPVPGVDTARGAGAPAPVGAPPTPVAPPPGGP